MKYLEFLDLLKEYAEPDFAAFQRKLIFTNEKILGVRTPVLRRLAREYASDFERIFQFPNEYYEVTFIQLTMASALPYEEFILRIDACVYKMDNWATCDSFKARCLRKNQDAFLPTLEALFCSDGEFYQRYVLVTLLSYYTEEKYLPVILKYLQRADTEKYYVHMAAAWLIAEVLIKHYETGVDWLKMRVVDGKTHDKAIQKATESFRLTDLQKEYLRTLKTEKRKR